MKYMCRLSYPWFVCCILNGFWRKCSSLLYSWTILSFLSFLHFYYSSLNSFWKSLYIIKLTISTMMEKFSFIPSFIGLLIANEMINWLWGIKLKVYYLIGYGLKLFCNQIWISFITNSKFSNLCLITEILCILKN